MRRGDITEGFHQTPIEVRFTEVDSYEVVWHGHYISYFEIGRLDLLKLFDLTPKSLKEMGYLVPIVSFECRNMNPARYGDELSIRTCLQPTKRPEFFFQYEIRRVGDDQLLATGSTKQVLIDLGGNLVYTKPKWVKDKLEEIRNYLNERANFRK